MTTPDELKDEFSRLTDEEKVAFMKSVMPSFCEVFSKNPEKMMSEMMPLCRDMMKSCNIDIQGIRIMMLFAAAPRTVHAGFFRRHPSRSVCSGEIFVAIYAEGRQVRLDTVEGTRRNREKCSLTPKGKSRPRS